MNYMRETSELSPETVSLDGLHSVAFEVDRQGRGLVFGFGCDA